MKQDLNKKILNVSTIFAIILPPFYSILSVCLQGFGVIENYDSINPAMILYLLIPFLLYIYIIDLMRSKRKLDIFDYIFFALVISGILSTIFSIDKVVSIFGKDFRHEGLLSIVCYYLLFINWKVNGDKKSVSKFIKLLIIIGVINSIYALLQVYTSFDFIVRYGKDPKVAIGFYGHYNFFGTLISTIIPILIYKILNNGKIKFFELLIFILLLISLINCQSTGPFIAFIITFIFLVIFVISNKKEKIKKILINSFMLIVISIIVFYSVTFINRKINSYNNCEMCNIQTTVKTGGTGRLDIWMNSLDIIKDNWLIGVGFDNFYLAYPNPKVNSSFYFSIENGVISTETKKTRIIDNAHNIYLHTFVSTGIIGLIPYLLLCLLTFIKGIKAKDNSKKIMFAVFLAYSIQAFTNISVVEIAPIYFIMIGLILSD